MILAHPFSMKRAMAKRRKLTAISANGIIQNLAGEIFVRRSNRSKRTAALKAKHPAKNARVEITLGFLEQANTALSTD
jgi:hypothetical protein|tara:strand:+ start:76959 stop:77192 length:234 start_codon:yes stop_codon:yes gene_type:complete